MAVKDYSKSNAKWLMAEKNPKSTKKFGADHIWVINERKRCTKKHVNIEKIECQA